MHATCGTFGRSLVLAAAIAVCVAAEARNAPSGSSPQPIAGGRFEASGVAHVPGTAGVLFVDDSRTREIMWMELDAAGRQRAAAVPVPLGADVTDLEGITWDGNRFYVVGSQSKKAGYDGDGIVRFHFDPRTRRVSGVERIRGLKGWLAEHVAELTGTARIVGDQALNIEGLAWDPARSRLLLGLRAPVVDGQALVVPLVLRDPSGPFAAANLRVDGRALRLPLGGAGIRSIEYDAGAGAFRVIAGAALAEKSRDFRIVEWKGGDAPGPLRTLATCPASLKPEGITLATVGGRQVSVLVFDVGRYALLSTP